jgi:DNA-binding NarL/FixJ family response regulator
MSDDPKNLDPHPDAWVIDALRHYVTELLKLNNSLEKQVQQRTTEAEARAHQLRSLAFALADTESRERKRLAHLLHDHFQQLVSAAKLKTGLVRRAATDEKFISTLKRAEELLEEALIASRTLATELSPPVLTDGGLIAALQWLARKMETDYNLRIALDCDPSAEPDSEQVRTLLFECTRELLFNVVKHAQTSQASLTLKIPSPGLLSLTVADSGKGFDTPARGGARKNESSFGLFSIRERLGFLGGLLYLRSAPGRGAAVEMSVPVGTATRPLAIAAENKNRTNAPTFLDRPARILVADDHKLFREGVIHLLSQEPDLTVVGEAADGAQAVESARDLKPDIVILDVSMPQMNGIQVAAQISRELPQTLIIGLSMHDDSEMANAMIAAGAAAYLSKTGASETLIQTVRSLVSAKPPSSHEEIPHLPPDAVRDPFHPTADARHRTMVASCNLTGEPT